MGTLKKSILENASLDGVDAVSGATLTSNAVFSAVKQAMGKTETVKSDAEVFAEIADSMLPGNVRLDAELIENVFEIRQGADGSRVFLAQGIGHYPDKPFKLAVMLDADGAVRGIEFVYSHETDGFGSEVLVDSYWSQYFGADRITRKSGGEGIRIDLVSGATETSVGLYDCIKAAFAQFEALK